MNRAGIRDKIKEAFKSNKNLKSRWSPYHQPNLYALDIFLQKSGYHLIDVLDHGSAREILLEPIKEGYLHPEITHDFEEGVFYTNVKKYGDLDASDLEGVISGYQNALGVVNHLESLDLSKLELWNDKEKEKEE